MEKLKNFLFTFSETTFFFVLYLYAKGWRTTRAGLPTLELRTTLVALIVLLLTLLFFTFYNNDYYWLSLIIVYFFLLPKFFTSISQNCRLLESQTTYFQRSQAPQVLNVISALKNKFTAFFRVRNVVIAYLIVILLVNSIYRALMGIAWDFGWVPVLSNELSLFIMVTYTCFVLAPSSNGVWLTSLSDLIPLIRAQHFINENSNTDNNEDTTEPWNLKKTAVIVWPSEKPSQKDLPVTSLHMSLAYEQEYVLEQQQPKRSEFEKVDD